MSGSGWKSSWNSSWTGDFEFHRDHLRVKKTGARVHYNLAVLKETLDWLLFYLAMQTVRLSSLLRGRTGARICCAPDAARPWYLLWPAAHAARARFINDPHAADAVVFFEDSTVSAPPRITLPPHIRRINFDCPDVSKSRVAEVFEAVFGYPLTIDPLAHDGPVVEKSEKNGAHDGRVAAAPCAPREGFVYQRLIDNTRADGLVEDLRCPTVFGRIGPVFLKRRPVSARFANENAEVGLTTAEACFTNEERAKLTAFARAMKLDWGGLDVLRDKADGRLYIVDVNKTDMGPPTALPLGKKLEATRALGEMLAAGLARPRAKDAAENPSVEANPKVEINVEGAR
ncbi:MAG: hypothetical protein PVI23_15475 [Maricaulaceae bacterium]|jgi:hypothetical protein